MTEGVVNVLKPPGMTSSDVVVDLRRIFSTRRVGHTGTLDPGAAGVLPVCVGRATRLFDYLVEKEKTYLAELRFGAETDTQDSYGACLKCSDVVVSREQLLDVLPEFTGEITQVAPMYSALKQNGKKLCDLARKGQKVERQTRSAVISSLELVEELVPNRFLIRIVCSRGTYVRTLCEDIGARLQVPAHMAFLLRTASGTFTIETSHTVAELNELKENGRLHEAVVSPEEALLHLPSVSVPKEPKCEKKLFNGVPLTLKELELAPFEGNCRVYCGSFAGVGRAADGILRMSLIMREDSND